MTDAPTPGWCDCTGTTAHTPSDHMRDCPKYAPPLRGPGSTEAARTRAKEALRRTIDRLKEQHR